MMEWKNDEYSCLMTTKAVHLIESGTYTFTATAQNDIGESGIASSHSIVIIPSPTQPGSLSQPLSPSLPFL